MEGFPTVNLYKHNKEDREKVSYVVGNILQSVNWKAMVFAFVLYNTFPFSSASLELQKMNVPSKRKLLSA